MKLFLIRHGATLWNKQGRLQGQADIPLSAEGRRQAQALATRFADLSNLQFFSSGLARALQTAAILAGQGRSVQCRPEFNERNFGQWQGKLRRDVAALHPDFPPLWSVKGWETPVPQGESLKAFAERVLAGFCRLIATAPVTHDIALVTHRGVIRMLVWHYTGRKEADLEEIPLDNANVVVFEARREGVVVRRAAHHLAVG
jgi:broad specificity phosphatase PhoE